MFVSLHFNVCQVGPCNAALSPKCTDISYYPPLLRIWFSSLLIPEGLFRLVGTDQPFLFYAHSLDSLLLALVTDLPGLLLAVLGVAVHLGFLGRVFVSNSQIFLDSQWQDGKMLENFSQYLWTSV